jgi:hypothetical protein
MWRETTKSDFFSSAESVISSVKDYLFARNILVFG